MGNNTIELKEQEVLSVIQTLKEIKPRGFNSMDRLVGLVMFFQNKLNAPPIEDGNEVK